jgi:uncharacterized phage infection (PIP) family protein YhgE
MEDKTEELEQSVEPKDGFLKRLWSNSLVKWTGSGLLVFLGVSFEHTYSKVLDTFWETETPAEIVKLNERLQESTSKLNEASQELKALVASIGGNSADNPELDAQLDELTAWLSSFGELLDETSSGTAKVALLSKTLEQDFQRIKSMSDGTIDGTPNLMLTQGQAVQVCNGLAVLGFKSTYKDRASMTLSGASKSFDPGDRTMLKKDNDSYVDFLGLDGEHAMFKLHCS